MMRLGRIGSIGSGSRRRRANNAAPPPPFDPIGPMFPMGASYPFTENIFLNGKSWTNHSRMLDYSIQRSTNSKIFSFDVQQGDRRDAAATGTGGTDPAGKERSEFNQDGKNPYGTMIWASFSFKVEAVSETYPLLVTSWTNLGQMHGGTGSPVLTFLLRSDTELRIRRRWGLSTDASSEDMHIISDFERGRWYNVVYQFRADPTGETGLIRVWIDGVLVAERVNVAVGYTDSDHTYWKWGIYRSTSAPERLKAWFANMEYRFGAGADLSERITAPIPIDGISGIPEVPPATSYSLVDTLSSTAVATSYTFEEANIGTATINRTIVVVVHQFSSGQPDTLSVSIGGRPMTLRRAVGSTPATTRIFAFTLRDDTLNTDEAELVVTSNVALSGIAVSVHALYGLSSSIPTNGGTTANTNGVMTATVTASQNGIVLAFTQTASLNRTPVWTNVNTVYGPFGGQSNGGAVMAPVAAGSYSVSVNLGPSPGGARLLLLAFDGNFS